MSTNATGTGLAKEHGLMERFDRLPKTVRRALADARNNFGVEGVPELIRSVGARKAASAIADIDVKVCARDANVVWGDGFDHIGVST